MNDKDRDSIPLGKGMSEHEFYFHNEDGSFGCPSCITSTTDPCTNCHRKFSCDQ